MGRAKGSSSELERLAMSFPGVTRHSNYEAGFEYQVYGRTFVRHREPRKDALDDAGQPLTDVIMFITPDAATKLARVRAADPFFTTTQFGGYNAVLLRESHLGALSAELLEQVVTQAWVARAPKAVSDQWLAEHPNGVDPDA